MKPYIKIHYSESNDERIKNGDMDLAEANRIFQERDSFCVNNEINEIVQYEIFFEDINGERKEFLSQIIGSGDGTVLNRFRNAAKLNLKNYEGVHEKSSPLKMKLKPHKDVFSILVEENERLLNEVIPRLETECGIPSGKTDNVIDDDIRKLCEFIENNPNQFNDLLKYLLTHDDKDVIRTDPLGILIEYVKNITLNDKV